MKASADSRAGQRYTADLSEAGRLKPAALAFYRFLVGESAQGPSSTA